MNYFIVGSGIILLPFFFWMLMVSAKVKTTFRKYSKIQSKNNITAAQMARAVLDRAGANYIDVKAIKGNLTDNFNPKDKCVYLSEDVYNSTSVAALGVAAHEVGHAIQFADNYVPMKLRSAIVPVASLGSILAFPLILVGIVVQFFATLSPLSEYFILGGIIFYGFTTLFTFITLPVELNASNRAKKILFQSGILDKQETYQAGKVLKAAAMTYIVSFVISLVQLLRLILIFLDRS